METDRELTLLGKALLRRGCEEEIMTYESCTVTECKNQDMNANLLGPLRVLFAIKMVLSCDTK